MLHMLLEHSKAGKAVGTKGMMIQNIKIKSGALAIRIDKEPLEIHGITLRKLTIEGSLNSVRRSATPIPSLRPWCPSLLTMSDLQGASVGAGALR